MKKNLILCAVAMAFLVACGTKEKTDKPAAEATEKVKTETSTEKSEPKEEKSEEEKIEESEAFKQLQGSTLTPKMDEKTASKLLQGTWELTESLDPAGQKQKLEGKSMLVIKGRRGTISIGGKDNEAIFTVTPKLLTDPNWLNGLFIDLPKSDMKFTQFGIKKLDESSLILELAGGMGGQEVYTRVK